MPLIEVKDQTLRTPATLDSNDFVMLQKDDTDGTSVKIAVDNLFEWGSTPNPDGMLMPRFLDSADMSPDFNGSPTSRGIDGTIVWDGTDINVEISSGFQDAHTGA